MKPPGRLFTPPHREKPEVARKKERDRDRRDHSRGALQRPSLTAANCFLFFGLMLLPVLALARLSRIFDPRVVCGYIVFISLVTWLLYRQDKRRAADGEWRISEGTLHLAEFFGGWPAGFLAQRILRHKIKKTSYQVTFCFIIVLHETVALDFLRGWPLVRQTLSSVLRMI